MHSRREFLKRSTLVAGGALPFLARPAAARAEKPLPSRKPSDSPRVAAVVTEYRPWSHADVIAGRFIQGFALDLEPHWARGGLRAMYVDQFPDSDLARPLSRRYGFPIVNTIREAILDASGKLACDGVLLIGEHGEYPKDDRGRVLYPRRRFFEETARAFEEAGEAAPVFTDKHLAARWEDSKWMYERAKALGIPFMAGSSLPYAWRRPWLELPLGAALDEALAVGYGPLEAYGFHALETLQCMVERRQGGESGVQAVQCLEGKAVWEAMGAGRFSRALLEAALARNKTPVRGDIEALCPSPAAFLIEYRDGFRAACLMLDPVSQGFLFAARLSGDARPVSAEFWLQEPTFGHFSYLSGAIIEFFRAGKPVAPVERTVITSGILSVAFDSRFEGHRRIETPELAIPYAPIDHDLAAHRHREAANRRHGGWVELFDGRSLDGFREVRLEGEPRWEVREGVLTVSGGLGLLATLEEFSGLELFAEARASGAAGIRLRAPATRLGGGSPVGLAPGGEWTALRVRAEGEWLRTWVNGRAAADERLPGDLPARGAIVIELREPQARLEVRELRVRRL